jgi:hypothetical protein
MSDERRDEERIPLSLEVRWEGVMHSARVSDISVDGCYIDTIAATVAVGELVSFELKLPGGEWLPLRGEVTHTQRRLRSVLYIPHGRGATLNHAIE